MPKKKQHAPVKEKKGKKKTVLSERELLSYEQQIIDKNKQLVRLQHHNEELENDAKNMKQKLEQLEADHSDVIAYLKRRLNEKIAEAEELNERLLALEETRKVESTRYKKKEEFMESAYETMKNNLNAELKLAVGKLNALEDWRIARLDLMHKLEEQEQFIKKQEEHYKEILHETERKIVNKKSRMKMEMVKRLNELAESFQEMANIYIADTTDRAIKENIILNKNLNNLQNMFKESQITIQKYKDSQRDLQLRSDLLEAETKHVVNKTLKQDSAILDLARRYVTMNLEYYNEQRMNVYLKTSDRTIEELNRKYEKTEERNEILEQRLHEIEDNYKQVLSDIDIICKKCKKLARILFETKKCIEETLQLQKEVGLGSICTYCNVTLKEVMLCTLLNILGTKDVENILSADVNIHGFKFESELQVC